MAFCSQLQSVVWKNFTIRRRQRLRLSIEIVWPLLLFLILMWVRTRGLQYRVHSCHFEAKALPSAGALPFLNSFVCSFNNTCHDTEPIFLGQSRLDRMSRLVDEFSATVGALVNNETTVWYHVARRARQGGWGSMSSIELRSTDVFPDSTRLIKVLRRNGIGSSDKQRSQVVASFSIKPSELVSLMTAMALGMMAPRSNLSVCDSLDFGRIFSVYQKQPDTAHIARDICKSAIDQHSRFFNEVAAILDSNRAYTWIQKQVENNWNISINSDSWERSVTAARNAYKRLLRSESYRFVADALSLAFSNSDISPLLNASSLFVRIAQSQGLICGFDPRSFFSPSVRTNQFVFEKLRDAIKERIMRVNQLNKTENSNECTNLFLSLEGNALSGLFWQAVKPLLIGKILYTPQAPAVEKLVNRMNDTFSALTLLSSALQQWTHNINHSRPVIHQFATILGRMQTLVKQTAFFADWESYFSNGFNLLMDDHFTSINPLWFKTTFSNITVFVENVLDNTILIGNMASRYLQCISLYRWEGVDSEEKLEHRGRNLSDDGLLLAGIVFLNITNDTEKLPRFVSYKIRMDADRVDSTKQIMDRFSRLGARQRPYQDMKYITFGYAYLQDVLERSIVEEVTEKKVETGLYLHQMPYPCYIDDKFILAISRTFPMFMVLSWLYSSAMIVKSMVYEKESRLKELMLILGLNKNAYWLGSYITSLALMMVSDVILTIILVYGKILQYSDPSVVFCFLTCYSTATVSFSFFISSMFYQANVAAAASGIIFFISYLPYPFMVIWQNRLSIDFKRLLCLLSNVAFGFGCSCFAHFEERGVGVQWSSVAESATQEDSFSLVDSMVMMLIDSVIYCAIACYVEAVWPGGHLVPRVWYFPLTSSYWCADSEDVPPGVCGVQEGLMTTDVNVEQAPADLAVGVDIKQLRKVYDDGKVAVNNLSVQFFQGQITCFLGLNGAGKTTTLSILTGLIRPSQGSVTIDNMNISTDMTLIRQQIGYCPQYNVLFDDMTVIDHFELYSRLKNRGKGDFQEETEEMISYLGLENKRDQLSKHLSGGMKRKLSIAIAFIGAPKTVILDEPTTGVDPSSRRFIWQLLLKYKRDRTVIFTTHFMDEADVLSDRIAVIAGGSLQSCGTSLFLKRRFGTGYRLTLVRSVSEDDHRSNAKSGGNSHVPLAPQVDIDHWTKFVREYVNNAQLLEKIGCETRYLLPYSDVLGVQLALLTERLDTEQRDQRLIAYGLSDASLEEVFLHLAAKADGENNCAQSERDNESSPIDGISEDGDSESSMTSDLEEFGSQHGHSKSVESKTLMCKHLYALLVKRFHHSRRNIKGLFSEIVLPPLFVCLAMIFTVVVPPVDDEPALLLSPWIFEQPLTIFFSNDDSKSQLSVDYEDELLSRRGLGVFCSKSMEHCDKSVGLTREALATAVYSEVTPCSCASGSLKCPVNATGPDPALAVTSSGDLLVNVTGRNVSDWLLKTRATFERSRWGGYTLDYAGFDRWNWSQLATALDRMSKNILDRSFTSNSSNVLRLFKAMYHRSFASDNVKIWFNNKGWPTSVAYMNAFNNVLLRSLVANTSERHHYGIASVNHPLPLTRSQIERQMVRRSAVTLLHALCVVLALSFVPASFTVHLVEERCSHCKHVQLVSGVSEKIFWLSEFIWGVANYTLTVALCVVVFVVFNEPAYVSGQNMLGLIALLLLYGWASIPMMFAASFMFDSPAASFVTLACVNLFIGTVTTVATFVLEIFDDTQLQFIASVLQRVFLIFPQYCLGRGLMDMVSSHLRTSALSMFGIEHQADIFRWNVLGCNLVCLTAQGCVGLLLTLLCEFHHRVSCLPSSTRSEHKTVTERTDQQATDGETLRLCGATKVYKSAEKPAVDSLSLCVRPGECVGLLGVNGAGKTTTFSLITGAQRCNRGDVFVDGHSVTHELSAARRHLGYCPQSDALLPLLTAREHLLLWSRLRGVSEFHRERHCGRWLAHLCLTGCADTLVANCSGGQRRLLSTALALMGRPSLTLLDEPTSGMDPARRRRLWRCIDGARDGTSSLLLSSHSMDECEWACSRLVLLAPGGRLVDTGSVQQLRSRHTDSMTLSIRCASRQCIEIVHQRLLLVAPLATLRATHHLLIVVHVPSHHLTLSQLLHALESLRSESAIEHFSLSHTTLDDIFIRYAENLAGHDEVCQRGSDVFRQSSDCCHPPTPCEVDVHHQSSELISDTYV